MKKLDNSTKEFLDYILAHHQKEVIDNNWATILFSYYNSERSFRKVAKMFIDLIEELNIDTSAFLKLNIKDMYYICDEEGNPYCFDMDSLTTYIGDFSEHVFFFDTHRAAKIFAGVHIPMYNYYIENIVHSQKDYLLKLKGEGCWIKL